MKQTTKISTTVNKAQPRTMTPKIMLRRVEASFPSLVFPVEGCSGEPMREGVVCSSPEQTS